MRLPDLRRPAAVTAVVLSALLAPLHAQAQQRLATDFEIAQMEKQIAGERGFEARLGARMNLGDARSMRNERALARREYEQALELAEKERGDARTDASLSRYANATSWSALAHAKLGRTARAFALLEEAARYASDDAEAWNLYASTMRTLGHPRKAVAAARNAVAVAGRTPGKPLDLEIYRHALATAHLDAGDAEEARAILLSLVESLRSPRFEELRKAAARLESFEVYSSARGDVAAYVSLLNRAQLRLAGVLESGGDAQGARTWYRRVLEGRSDDVIALGALARLAPSEGEREQLYAEAFEANPFSPALVREYRSRASAPRRPVEGATTGARVRRAIVQLESGELRAARASLDALLKEFPTNETLMALRSEAAGAATVAMPSAEPSERELRALLNDFDRITPGQRATLDAASFVASPRFEAAGAAPAGASSPVTVFSSGTIEGVPFRFATATAFAGTFDAAAPLRLTFRILGVTRDGDRDVLLLEPLRLEVAP